MCLKGCLYYTTSLVVSVLFALKYTVFTRRVSNKLDTSIKVKCPFMQDALLVRCSCDSHASEIKRPYIGVHIIIIIIFLCSQLGLSRKICLANYVRAARQVDRGACC